MPEYLIGIIVSVVFGGSTFLFKRIDQVEAKVDQLELKTAERYATKAELSNAMNRLESYSARIEDKLDQLIRTQLEHHD